MPKLKPTMSLEAQADYAVNAAAALNARSETRHLAAGWRTYKQSIRTARNAREAARDEWLEAAAEYHVARTDWYDAVKQVAGGLLGASNKKSRAEPYHSTLGAGTTVKVRNFGSRRAIDFGSLLLGRLGVLARPDLAESTAVLQAAQDVLVTADATRRRTYEALRLHDVHRVQLLGTLQAAANETQVKILEAFPGQDDRVRDVLAMPRDDDRRDRADTASSTPA